MKKNIGYILCSLLLFTMTSCEKKGQKLLLGGSGWNRIVIIDKETKEIEWEHPIKKGWEVNSVVAMPNGNILFSYSDGAKVITRDHKEVWKIIAPEGAQLQTARALPNGNYLLAWGGHPAVIMEVDINGNILSKVSYETGIENPHAQIRQVNKTEDGNYLVPLFATSDLRIINKEGEMVRSIKVGGTPFTTELLPNGNYLVACGDAHNFKEVNIQTGDILRTVEATEIPGTSLFFVAGLLKTSKSMYICNWQGHSKTQKGTYPQLIEIDDNDKMIWDLNDNAKFGMISSVSIVQ